MKFNVEKCKVLHYGKNSIGCQYNMYGQPLAEETAEKDLGAVFSNDLKVVQQCRSLYIVKLIKSSVSYEERLHSRIQQF